ncbi:KTSC domain-containing protein [Eisenibacter elegans]|jgi:lysyl-tRNA synthetase class 2|uniref:KTSC domain-containing protein n=1 Tax=Eisenibacter elegans TaxID=997 RepID=UPI000425B7D9|nr:KTSC domain-containing protein [Eisenibacter elegans]
MGQFSRAAANSSGIVSVSYDAFCEVLEIIFSHGGIYEYSRVPAPVVKALRQAKSPGVYFNEYIRPYYTYRKVRD